MKNDMVYFIDLQENVYVHPIPPNAIKLSGTPLSPDHYPLKKKGKDVIIQQWKDDLDKYGIKYRLLASMPTNIFVRNLRKMEKKHARHS